MSAKRISLLFFLPQLSKLEQIHQSGSSEAFDKKRTRGKRGGEKGKRGSCFWGMWN